MEIEVGDVIEVQENGGYYLNPETLEPQKFLVTEKTEEGYSLDPIDKFTRT